MGRGKAKIKFDVRDLLFPEQHINEQETVHALMKSPLFSIIAQIYNQSEKFLRVGKIVKGGEGEIVGAEIVSPLGFLVCRVACSGTIGRGGNVYFYVSHNVLQTRANHVGLCTANPRYLQSKIKAESEHPVSNMLSTRINNAKTVVPDYLRSMVDTMVDRMFGESISGAPSFDVTRVNDHTSTFMARYFAGEITLAEVPSDVRNNFDDVYGKFIDKREKFKKAIQKGKDFVDGEKWVYITNVNDGVVLGAIRPEPTLAALEAYTNGERLPDFTDAKYKVAESVPFKWYKSFDCIPEEYRAGLEYSLVMLKMHRGSDKMLPPPNSVGGYWQEMGCYSVGGEGDACQFMYLSR